MGWRELWGSCLGRARSSRPFWVPALEQSSGTQNGRELLALPRQESQSSHQQLEPKMALNSWVDVSFGVPVLEEPRVHGRFGFQLLNKALEPKTAVNSWLFQDSQGYWAEGPKARRVVGQKGRRVEWG